MGLIYRKEFTITATAMQDESLKTSLESLQTAGIYSKQSHVFTELQTFLNYLFKPSHNNYVNSVPYFGVLHLIHCILFRGLDFVQTKP